MCVFLKRLHADRARQSVAWRLRKEGMDATFKQYPDIKLLDRPTEGELKNMLSVTAATLAEFPDLDAVHAPSDTPSRGIVTALSWFNPAIRVFPPASAKDAFQYLNLSEPEVQLVRDAIRQIKAELGLEKLDCLPD